MSDNDETIPMTHGQRHDADLQAKVRAQNEPVAVLGWLMSASDVAYQFETLMFDSRVRVVLPRHLTEWEVRDAATGEGLMTAPQWLWKDRGIL